jgi:hypothetical protein
MGTVKMFLFLLLKLTFIPSAMGIRKGVKLNTIEKFINIGTVLFCDAVQCTVFPQ